MKRGLIIAIVFKLIALNVFAEWIAREEVVNVVPEEYKEAWVGVSDEYDEVFYRMMQLGRGVTKGEKLILFGHANRQPKRLDNGDWVAPLYTLRGDSYSSFVNRLTGGRVMLILSELPVELSSIDDRDRIALCIVFARYKGVKVFGVDLETETQIPILIVDQILIEKTVYDLQTFEYDKDLNIEDLDIDYYDYFSHYGG